MSNLNSPSGKRARVPWDGETQRCFEASIRECLAGLSASIFNTEVLQITREVEKSCLKFSSSFYSKMNNLEAYILSDPRGDESPRLEEFIELCKSRSGDLTRLLANLSVVDSEIELFLVHGEVANPAQNIKYISGKSVIMGVSPDDDELINVFTLHRPPHWFTPLFVTLIRVMELGHRLSNVDSHSLDECMVLANYIITISTLYLELRSSLNMILAQEKAAVEVMKASRAEDPGQEYWDLFDSVAKDIKEGKEPYILEFKAAMDATADYRESAFCDADYFVSSKTANSQIKGWRVSKSISFLNSCFETDPLLGHPCHEVIGYTSAYNKTEVPGYRALDVKACSIDQHKAKRRVIKMAINPVQDVCNYIHHRQQKFLNALVTDCSNNHDRGIAFTMKITDPAYRAKNGYPSTYNLDIKDATGNISQEFELRVMRLFWKPEIVDYWRSMLALPQTFRYADGTTETFTQLTGQPQGVAGSFDMFTTDHHFMMLMVMKRSGLTKYKASQFYRILGDDNTLTTIIPDPMNLILGNVKYVYNGAHWIFQLPKCWMTYHHDKIAIGEFAKVVVINGKISSPLPIRLMSRYAQSTNPTHAITTCIWGQNHNMSMVTSMNQIIKKWFGYKDLDFRIADTFIRGGLTRHFSHFRNPVEIPDDEFRLQVGMCFLVTKIKGTFLESLLDKDKRNDLKFDEQATAKVLKKIFGKNHDKWLDLIEDSDHKVLKMLRKNLAISDALNEILGITEGALLAVGLDLTDDERDVIRSVSEIYESVTETGQLNQYEFPTVRKLLDQVESFNRFQLHSVTKSAGREASYLSEVIQLYYKLFIPPEEENDSNTQPNQ